MASLTKNDSTPPTYTMVSSQQGQYEFDENGRITSRSDPQGHSFVYTYDDSGKLTRVSADNDTRYLTLGYDDQGRIVSVGDYTGRQVAYGYDDAGDLVSATDVLGKTWSYTYDSAHRMTAMIDPSGKDTVKTDYDMQGRAYRQFGGDGNLLARIVYNGDGTTTIYDALGHAETHNYNEHNELASSLDPLQNPTSKTYDANFRPSKITDPASHATKPDLERRRRQPDPDGGRGRQPDQHYL